MLVLLTGGSGVVGQAAVRALLKHGHRVRLLARGADRGAAEWPDGVEAWPADVASADELRGSADDCDAVLHCAGIVDESPPEKTFERVNVEGTRNVVGEATRAGVRRLVYVSSLGCDRGTSPYHASKRQAETEVHAFGGDWLVLRPGNVYGPGDDVISSLLTMVRTLPLVPVIDDGEQPFEPMWADDLGEALALAVERDDLSRQTLELAGPERTSMNDLIDRLATLTGRRPTRLPLPGVLASFGAKLADMVGISTPVNESQLIMLTEENVIAAPGGNALTTVFRVSPTSLDDGLARLADASPEQLPDEGVGALKRKRFYAEIEHSTLTAEALLNRFRERFAEITPWHLEVAPEPGTRSELIDGETLTMSLPLRGHIQVRVEEVTPRRVTLVTLAGHPIAGAVRFLSEPRGAAVRFEIQVYDRAASFVDWITMNAGGGHLQNSTWEATVAAVVAESGGTAPAGVQQETVALDEAQAQDVVSWLDELVLARQRTTNAASVENASPYRGEAGARG